MFLLNYIIALDPYDQNYHYQYKIKGFWKVKIYDNNLDLPRANINQGCYNHYLN